ncbi:hypothetical protein WJX72_009168 [[Myrmecia] bisecta]|uniref:Uncharacterized protein n=1 Tax=[Myrmecia] bisecta TaxID=41462 RepID=A0AAW1QRZ8_9CHLO
MVCYNATCARQIDVLHCQLEASERSRLMAEAALQRRTQECESLMRVVKELATSRATLVNLRTTQAERLAELQHEYLRVLRIADLARQVSKENIGKAAKAQKKLERAEDAIRLQRQTISDLKSHNAELRQDNLDLRQMCLLERIDLYWFGREFLRFAPTWDSGPGCAAAPAMADTELLGQAREPVWVM